MWHSSQRSVYHKSHVGFEKENCIIDKEGSYALVVGKSSSFLNLDYLKDTGPES